MADTRRTHRSRSRAGWVWVIVGIAAVGLIVWWIAAAVDEDEGVYEETGEISAVEETEQGLDQAGQELSQLGEEAEQELDEFGEGVEGDQIFEDQNGIFEEESEQADRSGQVLGEAPGTDEFEATDTEATDTQEPEGVQQFSQWNQEQQQAQVNEDYVRQGSERLGGAIDGVILLVPEQQLQQGEQVGGGPTEGQQDQPQQDEQRQQIQSQREQVGQSLDELQQAEAQQQPQAFSQAANNVVNLLSSMAQQANLDQQLDQPIQSLEQSAQQLQPDQPLAQQEQQVRDFFNQAEQVLSQMSQNLQQATGGGPTDGQQQEQNDGMTD